MYGKIAVIKVLRLADNSLGLIDAKNLVDRMVAFRDVADRQEDDMDLLSDCFRLLNAVRVGRVLEVNDSSDIKTYRFSGALVYVKTEIFTPYSNGEISIDTDLLYLLAHGNATMGREENGDIVIRYQRPFVYLDL